LFLIGAILGVVFVILNRTLENNKKLIVIFFSLYICSIIQFLILPIPLNAAAIKYMQVPSFDWNYINFVPLISIRSLSPMVLHFVIFLPFGGFVSYFSGKPVFKILAFLIVPFFVEFFQGSISWYFGILYKYADINEFLFGTIGCLVGALIFLSINTRVKFAGHQVEE